MVRRTAQQWEQLIQEQAKSGQTATAFCAARGIDSKYFSLRKSKLCPKPSKKSRAASKFIAIKAPSVDRITEAFLLTMGSVTLKIPSATSPQWMAQLMRGLS